MALYNSLQDKMCFIHLQVHAHCDIKAFSILLANFVSTKFCTRVESSTQKFRMPRQLKVLHFIPFFFHASTAIEKRNIQIFVSRIRHPVYNAKRKIVSMGDEGSRGLAYSRVKKGDKVYVDHRTSIILLIQVELKGIMKTTMGDLYRCVR